MASVDDELESHRTMLDDCLKEGSDIQSQCHQLAEQPMKHWMRILQARWDEVTAWRDQRHARLHDQLQMVRDQEAMIDSLLAFIDQKTYQLHEVVCATIPDDIEFVDR